MLKPRADAARRHGLKLFFYYSQLDWHHPDYFPLGPRPFPGEDFQMFEKDLPGQNTAGFNAQAEIGALPLETCDTINRAWGFNLTDRRYKSTRELIHSERRALSSNPF